MINDIINDILTFLLLVGIILLIPLLANRIEGYVIYKDVIYKDVYLFNYKYNLQELIEKNNLTKQEPIMSDCFDTNEKIKELAKNLTTIYDIQKWILEFPFDNEQLGNLSTHCQKATTTLENGKGVCSDKSILICSICYEKNISCYSVCGGNHCISLIYYNNSWRPILTTGYINKVNIEDFMSSLFLIESKDERYFKNIY